MPTTPAPLPTELSLMRIVAQGLVPATMSRTPGEVVAKSLMTQGQLVSAVPHSLITRTPDATGSDVRAAFESGELVRGWPFRGTLHIMAAADHHWIRSLWSLERDTWWLRTAERNGIDAAMIERARSVVLESVADQPLTRTQMRAAWAAAGVGSTVPAEQNTQHYLLFVLMHKDGTAISGRLEGTEHLVHPGHHAPGAEEPRVLALLADPASGSVSPAEHEAAHRHAWAELARRFATSHGPVTADDLARWAGTTKARAKQALADALAGEISSPAEAGLFAGTQEAGALYRHESMAGGVPKLACGHLEAAERSALTPGFPASRKAPLFYCREDLPELTEANREDASQLMYLSAFDELHVGYKDRSCLTDEAGEKLICPGANGMFRPLLVKGGRVVGVTSKQAGLEWSAEAGKRGPSKALQKEAARVMGAAAARLQS